MAGLAISMTGLAISVTSSAAFAGRTGIVGDLGGVVGMVNVHRNALADGFLNVTQIGALVVVAERDGDAGGAGPGRAADTVHVTFRFVGQVEVDDVGDAVDVDAASRNVGGHQGPDVAGTEALQGPLPGILGLVAVDGVGTDAVLMQVPGNPVGAVFGAGEDEHPFDVLIVH